MKVDADAAAVGAAAVGARRSGAIIYARGAMKCNVAASTITSIGTEATGAAQAAVDDGAAARGAPGSAGSAGSAVQKSTGHDIEFVIG